MSSIIFWILSASLLGFALSAIFAGRFKLKRNIYLLFYIPFSLAFFISFLLLNKIDIGGMILHNWYWGLVGAVLASVFVIKNVLSQPASESQKGLGFIVDIVWPGGIYGLTDSLLLSVLPVLAVSIVLRDQAWTTGLAGKAGFMAIAMAASLIVTTLYHLGYPEFRGKKVLWPNIGNGVLTLAYLLTMNPMAAILPHMAMHIAAMIHGRETTGQVPPHYND